ncbi:MAG: hypothetical protein Q8R26_03670 [bacterium]|nr:hypothetical protein [bacterium]
MTAFVIELLHPTQLLNMSEDELEDGDITEEGEEDEEKNSKKDEDELGEVE